MAVSCAVAGAIVYPAEHCNEVIVTVSVSTCSTHGLLQRSFQLDTQQHYCVRQWRSALALWRTGQALFEVLLPCDTASPCHNMHVSTGIEINVRVSYRLINDTDTANNRPTSVYVNVSRRSENSSPEKERESKKALDWAHSH